VIIPAQRAALIKAKALGNALNMERMPAPFGRPEAATTLLQADGACVFFAMETPLLQAKGFLQVNDEPFQVTDKNISHLRLRSAKCNSNEALHPVHQKSRLFSIRLIRTYHVHRIIVKSLGPDRIERGSDLAVA